MTAAAPSALTPDALARRLAELVGDVRHVLVDFLLHLEEFDRRRAWAEAGYDSLWSYCQRVLHLREGPAGRRIGAMRVLRRFPRLADALRDGRLCLSTVPLLAPLLRNDNLGDVVARAAYKTKAEVEHLVASVLPREAPRDGIRRLPERAAGGELAVTTARTEHPAIEVALATTLPDSTASPPQNAGPDSARLPAEDSPRSADASAPTLLLRSSLPRPSLKPVAAEVFSLRVTLDATLKGELDELAALLSHKVPSGDLAAVLREAVHCALEKPGRRRGARAPARERATAGPPAVGGAAAVESTPAPDGSARGTEQALGLASGERDPRARPHIPAHVRRDVWKRDGGRRTWRAPDGRRSDSRLRLELDHVIPFASSPGAIPTADGLRLLCRAHDVLHAEQVFGSEMMARYRRDNPGRVRSLIPG